MKPILWAGDRIIRLFTTDILTAPTNQTEPHVIQSPTIEGVVTRGFGFAFVAPDSASPNAAAVFVAAGLTITIHRLIPMLGVYAASTSRTLIQYKQQFVNFDMGGSQAFFFQVDAATITTPGDILLCFTELP